MTVLYQMIAADQISKYLNHISLVRVVVGEYKRLSNNNLTMSKPLNVTQKLIKDHLVDGEMTPGEEIGLKIDQTLTQDATGTLVMLELEAMELDDAKTEISCQYVDHNLLQTDFKNPDDHLFLKSAAEKFGLWFSRPGNGVSHPIETERFAIPVRHLQVLIAILRLQVAWECWHWVQVDWMLLSQLQVNRST